jgi:hypothetical protein
MASLLDDPSLELGGALDKVSPQTPVSGRVIRPPRSILDVVTGAGEAIGQDVGGMLQGLANYIKTPGMVASGEISMADVAGAAQGFAANTALLGAGLPAPAGALRTLGGINKAAALDTNALRTAQAMAAAGKDPYAIWQQTGFYRDTPVNWRFEMPDQAARVVNPVVGVRPASEAFDHPELFRQYPQLADLPVRFMDLGAGNAGVLYKNDATRQPAFMQINSMDPVAEQLKTFLHEGQHGIQMLEDLPGGAQVSDFLADDYPARRAELERRANAGEDVTKPWTEMDKEYLEAWEKYQKVPGEVEARNVEDRHDMTAEMAKQIMPSGAQGASIPAPVQWTWPNILSALAGLQPEQQ